MFRFGRGFDSCVRVSTALRANSTCGGALKDVKKGYRVLREHLCVPAAFGGSCTTSWCALASPHVFVFQFACFVHGISGRVAGREIRTPNSAKAKPRYRRCDAAPSNNHSLIATSRCHARILRRFKKECVPPNFLKLGGYAHTFRPLIEWKFPNLLTYGVRPIKSTNWSGCVPYSRSRTRLANP